MPVRLASLALVALFAVACTTATPATAPPAQTPVPATPAAATPAATAVAPTPAPITPAPETAAPTAGASAAPGTVAPGSSLDPSLSDAGIVGRVTISNDTRGGRDGTHEIIGVAADGSDCSYSFEGDEFTAVAWYDDAPNGYIHQMAVTVPADTVPANDGEVRSGIPDGRAYIDFVSESGFGTAYYGDPSEENGGSVTVGATLSGETLTFDFTGKTGDNVDFSGQLACAGMGD